MTKNDLRAWLLLAGFDPKFLSTEEAWWDHRNSFYRKTERAYYEFVIVNFPGDARIIVSTRNTYDVFLAPDEAADHVRSILGE